MSNNKQKLYSFDEPVTAHQVLEKAAEIVCEHYTRDVEICNPNSSKNFLRFKLSHQEREFFAVMLLDSQQRLIEYQELSFGTIDAASIYPREIVKAALKHNAAAMILAHNHPSSIPEPSAADISITTRIVTEPIFPQLTLRHEYSPTSACTSSSSFIHDCCGSRR
ncbi:hypothetical protein N8793_00290 [Pseudomonadales bacterium]|nr:hypothetical protein [Pseudomonadales bacterium]